jgi:IS5 family transposase
LNFRHLLETRWSETSTGRLRANAALSGRWLMAQNEALQAVEKANASVRAFVVKSIFRYRKVRYRGLAKNGQQLYTLFGLANVLIGARARATA